jgi:hypothetical protein
MSKNQSDQLSGLYTEEMRQRALARIAEDARRFDRQLLFDEYMGVMFKMFLRRLKREHPELSASGIVDEEADRPVAEDSDSGQIRRSWRNRPRRRVGETDEELARRRAEFDATSEA